MQRDRSSSIIWMDSIGSYTCYAKFLCNSCFSSSYFLKYMVKVKLGQMRYNTNNPSLVPSHVYRPTLPAAVTCRRPLRHTVCALSPSLSLAPYASRPSLLDLTTFHNARHHALTEHAYRGKKKKNSKHGTTT